MTTRSKRRRRKDRPRTRPRKPALVSMGAASRDEAITQLEGLQGQHEGAKLWTNYDKPALMIPTGKGCRLYLTWDEPEWIASDAYEAHGTLVCDDEARFPTLAECLAWHEGRA